MRVDTIEIKGIHRSANTANSNPGGCHDIQNLRRKDGGWRPVKSKKVHRNLQTPSNYSSILSIYKHDMAGEDEYVMIVRGHGGGKTVIHALYSMNTPTSTRTLRQVSQEDVLDITFIDNIAIITTNLKKTFHIYKEGVYVLNSDIDSIPEIRFALGTVGDIPHGHVEADTVEGIYANYLEYISNKNDQGDMEGEMFVRFAFKMKDGTFIRYSAPYWYQLPAIFSYPSNNITYDGRKSSPRIIRHSEDIGAEFIFKMENIRTASPYISIFQFNPGDWKEAIQSLCVFITPPRSVFKITATDNDYETVAADSPNISEYMYPKRVDVEEYFNDSLFYLSNEIPIEDLTEHKNITIDFKNIVTKEKLPPDQLSDHQLLAKVNKVINGRIHMGNITVKHFDGWQLALRDTSIPGGAANLSWYERDKNPFIGTTSYPPIYTEVELSRQDKSNLVSKTNEGERAVIRVGTQIRHKYFPLLAYPHPLAKSVEIWKEVDTFAQRRFVKAQLKTHQFYSFSYYLNLDSDGWPLFIDDKVNYVGEVIERPSLPVLDLYYDQPNRVQLSAVLNPFINPAINSYNIGSGLSNRIKAIGIQSAPTSEGQFGQFPLAIFSDNGVDLMDAGSGGVVYGAIRNISRIKSDSELLEADQGILFSNKDGLFVLQGRSVSEATRNLVGITSEIINPASNIMPMADMQDFTSFLREAKFMFDEHHMEVVIYKPGQPFTIRFNMKDMMFFRVGGGFDSHYISNGVYYGIYSTTIYDMNSDIAGLEHVHVGFQTNPVIHEARNLKKLNQSRLAGFIAVPPSDIGLHYKIYGSNRYSVDTSVGQPGALNKETRFGLIQEYVLSDEAGSIEPLTADNVDYTADNDEITADTVSIIISESGAIEGTHEVSMLTGRAYQSVIYLLYRFGGVVRSDSVISEIQTSIEDRFAKKMR